MPGRTTELPLATAPADADVIDGTDVDDTSEAPTGTSKRHPLSLLKTYFQSGISGGGGGAPQFVVASSTAHATIKARADYLCDGSGDEVQINTALALGSTLLTDGDYTCSAPIAVTKPGHSLRGVGRADDMGVNGGRGFGTRIKGAAGFVGEAQILVDQSGGYIVGQATVADLTIEGTGITSTTVDGIKFKGYQGTLWNVFVESARQHGIHWLGNVSPDPQWSPYDSMIAMCQAARCGGAGLYIGNDGADMHVTECIFLHNTGAGIEYAGGSSGQFTQIHCYSNKNAVWFRNGAGTRSKFANCKFEHSEQHGIFFDGTSGTATWTQWVNCGFGANGEQTHNTYDHINFTGPSTATKTQFIGCHFGNQDSPANLARYCINLGTAATGTLISGCYFGWVSGNLGNAGVATGLINITNNNTRKGTVIVGCAGVDDYHGDDSAPSVAAGASAGGTPPGPVLAADSTNRAGNVTFGTGTAPSAGAQLVVTYSRAKYPANQQVMITPKNAATAALNPYISAESASSFTVAFASAPAASQANTTYAIGFLVGA